MTTVRIRCFRPSGSRRRVSHDPIATPGITVDMDEDEAADLPCGRFARASSRRCSRKTAGEADLNPGRM